jgi:hypothetical protein
LYNFHYTFVQSKDFANEDSKKIPVHYRKLSSDIPAYLNYRPIYAEVYYGWDLLSGGSLSPSKAVELFWLLLTVPKHTKAGSFAANMQVPVISAKAALGPLSAIAAIPNSPAALASQSEDHGSISWLE